MASFKQEKNKTWSVQYAFFLLYWTGIRLGELLALNIADIDFEKNIKCNKVLKSYRWKGCNFFA